MGKAKRQARKAARKARRSANKSARQEKRAQRKENRQERREVRKENRADRKAERKENRKGRNVLGKVAHSIGGSVKGAAQSAKEIAKDTATNISELPVVETIGNRIEGLKKTSIAYWKSSNGTMPQFPETSLSEIQQRPNFGICFSGGGCRSAVASFGAMRALVEMGLDSKLRYTTSNSGGSWFAVPYTFLPSGISDAAFFGKALSLNQIQSVDQLRSNAEGSLFCVALTRTNIWRRSMTKPVLDGITKSSSADDNWSRAVGNAILKPFGLYDAQRVVGTNKMFTWSAQTRNQILRDNKHLEPGDFHVVERSRPFNITIGVAIRPGAYARNAAKGAQAKLKNRSLAPAFKDMALLEMSPLYGGVATNHNGLGGGYIESFGLESKPPQSGLSGSQGKVDVKFGKAHNRFTLSDVTGISGSALAALRDITNVASFTPRIRHWALSSSTPAEQAIDAIDGGYLETQAIIPLLKRKTQKIIACVNAAEIFSGGFKMKPGIAHLFGDTSTVDAVTIMSAWGNQVFDNSNGELETLRQGLIRNNRDRNVSFYSGTYKVVANANYGTEPYEVEILWYVLDKSKPWTELIERLVRVGGMEKKTVKSLQESFPNYKTARLNLTREEVSLLSNFTHWSFKELENELRQLLSQARKTSRPQRSAKKLAKAANVSISGKLPERMTASLAGLKRRKAGLKGLRSAAKSVKRKPPGPSGASPNG